MTSVLRVVVVQYWKEYCHLDAGSDKCCSRYNGVVGEYVRRFCGSRIRNTTECLDWFYLSIADDTIRGLQIRSVVVCCNFRRTVQIWTVLSRNISVLYRPCRFYSWCFVCRVNRNVLILKIKKFRICEFVEGPLSLIYNMSFYCGEYVQSEACLHLKRRFSNCPFFYRCATVWLPFAVFKVLCRAVNSVICALQQSLMSCKRLRVLPLVACVIHRGLLLFVWSDTDVIWMLFRMLASSDGRVVYSHHEQMH